MAYVIPSVLVYQQLASNAGVANVTPDLDTCIIGPAYNVVAYVAGSATSLVRNSALAAPTGVALTLTNNAANTNAYLGSTKPGQLLEVNSLQVYFNNARVETKISVMTGAAGQNALVIASYIGSCDSTAGTYVLSNVLPDAAELNVGDRVSILGVGVSGTTLITTVVARSGYSFTVADLVMTTATGTTITKTSFNNLNSVSATLRVEPGDSAVISYGATTLTSSVIALTKLGNVVTGITIADVLPVGVAAQVMVSVRKSYNNLLLPISFSAYTNYSTASAAADNLVVINPFPKVSYGTVVMGEVHIAYRALRLDLAGSVLDINNVLDQQGVLGDATEENPLALGVNLALANTIGRIKAVAISSNDLSGYLGALDLIENDRVYAIVPLTQRIDILAAVQQHVEQMSTPQEASWRIALVNTAIPSVRYIGIYNPDLVNANSGNNFVSLVAGDYVLNSSNAQFISDGAIPGDIIKVTSHTPTSQVIMSVKVLGVVSNQQVIVDSPIPLTAVSYYVQRNLSRTQQADIIAASSETFKSSRVIHVQPDLAGVVVNGVTKYLPGFYLCAAMSGLVSGLPAQQSLTNIGLAGIIDLQRSNRYFTRAQLSTIAAAGTCLLVQEAIGTIPYIRHSLTTDMTVLQYREIQQVKNIDFLSYFFHDILRGFPGRYNITPDTLQILRTTIIAGAKLLQGKRLPKIGPPLLDYQIKSLAQDPVNKDSVIIEMPVTMPTVMNFINLYLIY